MLVFPRCDESAGTFDCQRRSVRYSPPFEPKVESVKKEEDLGIFQAQEGLG